MSEYDAQADGAGSYLAAIEAKREKALAAIKREVVIGDARLLLGDCTQILPAIGAVHAVLMDPPYEQHSTGPGKSFFGSSLNKFDKGAYKDIISGFDYEALFPALEAICRPFNMFCFCSNKQISRLMAYHETRGRSTTLLVWHKTNAAPFAHRVWRGDIEYCIHAKEVGATFQGSADEKKKVSEHPIVADLAHPTVKPRGLIEKYVRIFSSPGQIVLDPYMGSGTTGAACVKLGRKFVGIELSEEHFETAVERIQDAYSRPDMFIAPPAPEPVQEALI